MNFAFIGARGAGKSRLSRKFAKRIDQLYLSTDTLLSYEAGGMSIRQIVEKDGWQGLREQEYHLLQKLVTMESIVIDCGGGIIVDLDEAGNEIFSKRKTDLLKHNCRVVYLRRDLKWLLSRGSESSHRPQLSHNYEAVIEKRLPWYEQVADYTLDLTGRDVTDGIEELVTMFKL
ncbi:MAG: shikimate kinase [Leptonema sp. (in: Bacteria)]|nr:shikimate kinase [Leptonema sp. (in: bacteria)]